MKKYKYQIISFCTAIVVIVCFFFANQIWHKNDNRTIKAGFIYIGDGANPYTKNFMQAQKDIEETYGDRVTCIAKYNITVGLENQYIQELLDEGCDIIFGTSYDYAPAMKEFAEKNPDTVFCQATGYNASEDPVLSNYHTYMGHIYEGRYTAGVVAGMKITEMIQEGLISDDEALVGYVAAYPYAEVISGYTAFLMGVRSTCPSAHMKVKYSNTWSNYTTEKNLAKELIDEGCVLISQHSDTTGSSVACEEAQKSYPVYHISYNQSMKNVAPTTSLTGCRIDWSSYEVTAIGALLENKTIESALSRQVTLNGLDAGAGFADGWVEMLELNEAIAPKGAQQAIDDCIKGFQNGSIHVFSGDYTGTDPFDKNDTIDLSEEYKENETSSSPQFHYVLDDVIEVE